MRAYVFSIGESTTSLCCNLLREMGFEIILLNDKETSLWDKLKAFYEDAIASGEEEFLRVDADIIPNKDTLRFIDVPFSRKLQWKCAMGWDWYKNCVTPISIHHMSIDAIKTAYDHIEEAKEESRPETYLWRLPEFERPRSCWNLELYCGLHGYGQQSERERIIKLKKERGQEYDWKLIDAMEAL